MRAVSLPIYFFAFRGGRPPGQIIFVGVKGGSFTWYGNDITQLKSGIGLGKQLLINGSNSGAYVMRLISGLGPLSWVTERLMTDCNMYSNCELDTAMLNPKANVLVRRSVFRQS